MELGRADEVAGKATADQTVILYLPTFTHENKVKLQRKVDHYRGFYTNTFT